MVDVGIEPTTQKTHGLSTTPFVKVISGVLVRLCRASPPCKFDSRGFLSVLSTTPFVKVLVGY